MLEMCIQHIYYGDTPKDPSALRLTPGTVEGRFSHPWHGVLSVVREPIMSTQHISLRGAGAARRIPTSRASLLATALAALLVACGGGGGDTTTPPPQARSSFTSGAISGFGSVIVNGVRFDDSGAEVLDDDGNRHGVDDLKLGAQVEVEASDIDRAGGHGVATRIRFGSEILGPVEAVDLAGQQLTVLGQTVAISPRTVFDDNLPGGLAGISAGAVLEVHAQFDAARAAYVASRIEAGSAPAAFKLRGLVEALDGTAHTFRIGAATINYASASEVTPQLANGVRVRVLLATAPVGGQWVATQVQAGERHHDDHGEAEVKGLIDAWTSATQFSVNGLAVDASAATFPDGQSGVVLGAMVEVEGTLVDGVLVATKVHLEDEEGEHERGEDYELHGGISALDTAAHTFSLRGLTVAYGETTEWRDLAEADLADGLMVEVKGNLSDDGTQLTATRISRED